MEFTLSSSALSGKLAALAKVINSKNQIRLLDDIVFKVEGQDLVLTASDVENTIITTLPLNASEGDQTFSIEAHLILDAIKALDEEPIQFIVDGGLVTIKYHNGHYILPIQDPADYPMPEGVAGDYTTIEIDSTVLAENLTRALFATAADELRPVMAGVFFDRTAGHLAIVASDGHKLVSNQLNEITADDTASFVLPKKPATLLSGLIEKDDSKVTIKFGSKNAEIAFGDTLLICRLLEGNYPNYRAVIPTNNDNRITIERQGMLTAVRRVLPFTSKSSQLMRIHIESGMMRIDGQDVDFAKTAMAQLSCDYDGTPMNIGFKAGAMADVLANIGTQEVVIALSDPSRAGLVFPKDGPADTEVVMLLMPMLIND